MNSRRSRLRSALAVIMTVLVLVPTAVLFGRVWQDNSDRHDSTALEQKGVEYLTALAPLINSLVEYQSSALQGVAAPDSLKPAIAQVAAVDSRLGVDLKTTDRWTGLQDKIKKLSSPITGGTLAVFQAHTEVIDLTVALYDAVRRNSELNRDPDNDLSNLQQAVAVDMPDAVQMGNAMGDWAFIAQAAPAASRGQITVQFGESVLDVQRAVAAVTGDLQAAVEDTNSKTLSGTLESTLDQFRRAIESMNRGANFGGQPNVATIATAQSTLQTALTALAGVTLHEMAGLLDDRLSTLTYRRTEAIVMGLLVIVLVAVALFFMLTGRRRETPAAPPGETTRDIVSTGRPGGYGPGQYDQVPAYGEVNPTRREQSGALR